MRGGEKITLQIQADLYPTGQTRLAAPSLNHAMPLNLQSSAPDRTP
jgi:hypothetical protein